MIRLCFNLAWAAGLASVALWAAGPVDTETAAPRRITTVIHPDLRTGRLVRSVMVTSKPVVEQRVTEAPVAPRVVSPVVVATETKAPPATGIDEAIEQIAAQVSLPSQVIHSVIKVESNYDPFAISPKGAQGLMQLIPSTARRFGVSNVFNPAENIQGGSKYLKYLLNLFEGNYALALAAYNAGEAAVARYGSVPPFPETRNYLILVARQLQEAKKAEAAKQKAVAAGQTRPDAETKPAGPNHIQEVVEADGSVRYVSTP
ncbi:MAG: lytic transglycosylase domain-containing protein [Bryobacteraceae bacterium]